MVQLPLMKPRLISARKWALKDLIHQNICALIVLTLIVLLGNIIWVSGFRNENPLVNQSLLGNSSSQQSSGEIVGGGYTIDPNIGYTTQALGATAARDILHGHMPYWNYDEGIGSPLLGEMQSAALLPTTLLFALPNGVLIEHIILEIIAGYFTYLFIRRLKLRGDVALLVGVMFALNGTFAWINNAAFNPIAFLPVMLYGLEALIQNIKTRTWLWLPIGLALSLFAGFPETAFIDILFVILWVIARFWQRRPRINYKQLLKIAGAFVLGMLIAAPIIVAFVDYLPNALVGAHNGTFSHVHLGTMALVTSVFPYIFGTIFSPHTTTTVVDNAVWGSIGGYVNISVLFFTILGLFSHMNNKLKAVLLFWIVACGLRTFGWGVAEDLWNLIPTIKNSAFFRYCVPSVYFACTVLAAYGVQGVLKKAIPRNRLIAAYGVVAILFFIIVLLAKQQLHYLSGAQDHIEYAVGSVLWAAVVISLLAITIVIVKRKYVYPVIFFIVLVDVGFMFFVPSLSTPKTSLDKSSVTFLQDNLGTNRFYTLGPIAPNYGSYFNIAEINENDLPVSKLWANYIDKHLDPNTNPIVFTGYSENNPEITGFDEFVSHEKNFEDIGTKYLVTFPGQLTSSQVNSADLSLKLSSSVADVYQLPYTQPFYQSLGKCSIVSGSTLSNVVVNCSGSGSVIRRELYMPGWKVNVDGKATKINKYNKLLQSINLTKGTHDLKFNFSPPHIILAWVSFLGGIIIVIYSLLSKKLHNRTAVIIQRIWSMAKTALH